MAGSFQVYYKGFLLKGNLAYEYNPFRNYQTDEDLYEVTSNGKNYLIPKDKAVKSYNGEVLEKVNGKWIDKRGNVITLNIIECNTTKPYASSGSLIDLDTNQLNFDLNHPVDITVLPSYDGSVNLILNDDKNIPRLINSRFSPREKNTYEIVDRIGENDTNIYSSNNFDKDTSLYFLYEKNPIVKYYGFVNGVLPVGQYCFYFTYCDADDNESDYIAETGVIPVFLGSDKDPNSIDGGIKNQRSDKGIRLQLSEVDKSYNYLKVYYVRYFADYGLNRVFEGKKIIKRYPINSDYIFIQITGHEDVEDIDPNILNITRFNPKSVLTQAQCKNILFFGNIVKNVDNYRELSDCALRIVPSVVNSTLSTVNNEYESVNGYGYYDSINMYTLVSYANNEYYRFGVVFIYLNGTLSNVYNTIGGELGTIVNNQSLFETGSNRIYIPVTDDGWINGAPVSNAKLDAPIQGNYLNARGVVRFSLDYNDNTTLYIKFTVPIEVLNYLKTLGIRGLFFVRQKRVPHVLALCYLMPMDEQLEGPVIELEDKKYYTECFITLPKVKKDSKFILPGLKKEVTTKEGGRDISNDYTLRLYEYKFKENEADYAISSKAYAAICPDFLLNLPYYNQIFNGSSFKIRKIKGAKLKKEKERMYYTEDGLDYGYSYEYKVIINTVTEDVPTIAIKDKVYRLEMGETEEAFRFRYAEVDSGLYDAGDEDYDSINEACNLVRGKFSPYLAIYSNSKLDTGAYYEIYLDSGVSTKLEYLNRMDSRDPFYSISDRVNFSQLEGGTTKTCYRGDCYTNKFTYRLNRNFNDPSLPNSDEIIDKHTWRDNYDVLDLTKWTNISRADLNAVQMGSWITINVKSPINYALRSEDHSFVSEEALMGAPRSFYPRNQLMWRGENKMPDSYLYNDAYRATLGYKCYFALYDVNYIKDSFSNRILYSAISILDSFKNNFRVSLSTYFRDYSLEYGGITKLVGFEGHLLVVFEHAIGIAVVNERILAGQGEGEPVFINTKNVLPEELTMITDTYGTLWSESVVKSESGAVYGVDTVAKKIWRVKGEQIEILSDFKVGKFLIDNISLGERELYPIVGLRNVKTHYNNNKKDIMFTFYDDIYRDEEKVWNLCFNELLDLFITFYSWVPSYSENIDTLFFSFDRTTSKELALIDKCNSVNPDNYGILVNNPIYTGSGWSATLSYVPAPGESKLTGVTFELLKDHWKNNTLFNLIDGNLTAKAILADKVYVLYVSVIKTENNSKTYLSTESIAITTSNHIAERSTKDDTNKLAHDFYLHGQAGIFDVVENLYPTFWYGEYHPFEFEFVVNDKIGLLKIFNNLILISNKAEPESFHFEIEGDNYDFSEDKRAMYFRQEATKNLFLNLGSDILYDRKFTDVIADPYTYELYYRSNPKRRENKDLQTNSEYTGLYKKFDKVYPIDSLGLVQQVKSTIFPLYYKRVDTYNEIYHEYREMLGGGYDFKNLSGSEIKWDRDLNQFNVVTHIKNSPIDLVGRLRGNSRYKEGKWNILIPSIIFNLKNETSWTVIGNSNITNYDSPLKTGITIPPIIINQQLLPNDLRDSVISSDKLPNIYGNNVYNAVKTDGWTYRQEARIRDKWMKVRVRYSGKNLAVIHSIITLYNISYS